MAMITAQNDKGMELLVGVSNVAALFPLDIYCFRKFKGLYGETGEYTEINLENVRGMSAVISNLKTFAAQPSQKAVFTKFLDALSLCSSFGYVSRNKEHKHHLGMLRRRYDRLFRTLHSNSVLFQHFGMRFHNRDVLPCDFYMLDKHKICKTHSFGLNNLAWEKCANTSYQVAETRSYILSYDDVNFFGELDDESEDDENQRLRFNEDEQFRGREDVAEFLAQVEQQCQTYRSFGTVLNLGWD